MTKYILEIYPPSGDESIALYESETPFGSFAKGDYYSRAFLSEGLMNEHYIIKEVRHLVWQAPKKPVTHKICIYTKEVSVADYEKSVSN